MKTISMFGVVVAASISLSQPIQGRSHGGGRSFSSGPHHSAAPGHYSSAPRHYSGGNARYYRSSPRSYSQAAYRNRAYAVSGSRQAVNRTTALRPKVNASRAQLASARRSALRSQGFDSQGRVLAQSSRNWNRNRDHYWNGHRCHWRNNAWVIIDPWLLYPWGYGYGYYPYGAYSYYDDGYYDNGYYGDVYVPGEYSQSEYYNGDWDSGVGQVQAALAKKGYYRGAVDGRLGPETRSAVRQYQRNHGLEVTGRVDRPVVEALQRR